MRQPVPVDEENPDAAEPTEPQEIPYPEIPAGAEYLVALFHSAGVATQTGMGLIPLSWQEIEAFVKCTQASVTPWELRVIRKMSEAYCAEYARASDRLRKAPYQAVIEIPTEEVREAVAAKVMSVLATFKRK
jgi:hypothetical protein